MHRRTCALILVAAALPTTDTSAQEAGPAPRPNFLWITCEDAGTRFGCYGDSYAQTPRIDAFAATGVTYRGAFSHASVPTTSLAGSITSEFPSSTGAHHVPARTLAPKHIKCFSQLLRAGGYHCTNQHKEHYGLGPMRFSKQLLRANWSPFAAWDFSGDAQSDWRSRARKDQPFFAIMGFKGPDAPRVHSPDRAVVPPYLADTPVTRGAIAAQYDRVHAFDNYVGEILDRLKEDGLEESTIVWICTTNGPDLPRQKRWLYDAGTKVALIVKVPRQYQQRVFGGSARQPEPGTSSDELISTMDFGPTTLSVAHLGIPRWMRGRAFLGRKRTDAPDFLFAARDRIDEACDCVRSVRDSRFLYIRNHMPHEAYSQRCSGQDANPAMQELRRLHATGKLPSAAERFFSPKPTEELYDSHADPHQVQDLSGDPAYRDRLVTMREAQIAWSLETRDVGLIPEVQFNRFKIQKFGILRCPMPVFRLAKDDRGRTAVQIACSTADSSVIYQVDGRGEAGPNHWNLYTEPVSLLPGQVITAHGVGIGNNRSLIARFKIGDPQATQDQVEASFRAPHWTRQLSQSKVLETLQDFKRKDLTGAAALSDYREARKETLTDLRYWALLGMQRLSTSAEQRGADQAIYVEALQSSSDAVRMASARVLASVPRHQAAALDAIRKLLYAPNYHAAFEGAQALGRIGIHGAALKKDAENLLGRIEKVDEQAGYLPPPLGQSRTLCQRFLDSLK